MKFYYSDYGLNLLTFNRTFTSPSNSRHPLPDFYTLMLQLFPERQTRVREELCDPRRQSPTRPRCPKELVPGVDWFSYRDLNEPCPGVCHSIMS